MEEYIKIKAKLTCKMSCDDIMDRYRVGEYNPQDLTISKNGIILTFNKRSNEIKGLNKYI